LIFRLAFHGYEVLGVYIAREMHGFCSKGEGSFGMS
jgi:hypothetical protein